MFIGDAKKRSKFKNRVEKFNKLPDECKELFFEIADIEGFESADLYLSEVLEYSEECESPIEALMLMGLCFVDIRTNKGYPFMDIEPQVEVECEDKTYRVDFMIHSYPPDRLGEIVVAVECDGHNFHEKTKEQVRKNNERDFALKMRGIEVLHFSGSEIYESPIGCAIKVAKYIESRGK